MKLFWMIVMLQKTNLFVTFWAKKAKKWSSIWLNVNLKQHFPLVQLIFILKILMKSQKCQRSGLKQCFLYGKRCFFDKFKVKRCHFVRFSQKCHWDNNFLWFSRDMNFSKINIYILFTKNYKGNEWNDFWCYWKPIFAFFFDLYGQKTQRNSTSLNWICISNDVFLIFQLIFLAKFTVELEKYPK